MTLSGPAFGRRIAELRTSMVASAVDAFVVTSRPNLFYLTGFDGSAGAALIRPTRAFLMVDFRYLTAARDMLAARGERAIALERVDGDHDEAIVALLEREGAQRIGVEAESMSIGRFTRLSTALASAASPGVDGSGCPALVPLERLVESMRAVKDDWEIAVLREAARRLSAVAREIPALAREGREEVEIADDINAAIRRAGFSRPAFETIVASGPNSALPHARPGRRRLQSGDGVVLDFGGVYDGYCVDLTRTIQVGRWRPDFRRIFDAVLEAQRTAIAAVRPGVSGRSIDRAARDVLTRHGLGDAFGHGTGHGLGLEVHEEPRISRTAPDSDGALAPGMVFTIEPGAYVAGTGGVRIEDDVLVTEGGCEVLTDVPKEI